MIATASLDGSWWCGSSGFDDVVEDQARDRVDGRRPAQLDRSGRSSVRAVPRRAAASARAGSRRRGCWPGRCRPGSGPRWRPAPRRAPRGRSRSSRLPGSPRCRRRCAAPIGCSIASRMVGMSRLGSRLVYRLPGPSTMSSASAIAARASSEARTSSGVIQTRSMPAVRMISDWPSTTVPSASRAWRVSGVGETGTTWPRTARIRFISRMPSSKSPPSTAVIAAISRLPSACPARPLGCPPARVGEAVLEDLAHQRLGVGQGRDAVADVADRRDAELGPQHARRAAVVGDGHDRGQVAGVLLEAAQQRRQPGPATDGHDPRPARQEALLVDELDQRLLGIGRSERIGQDARPRDTTPKTTSATPTEPATNPRSANGRNWRVSRSMSDAGQAGRLEVAGDLAQEVRERDRQQQQPGEDDEEPALDPDAGRQPAPEVHVRSSSRWKTATGPRSCSRSQAASSSAMTIERW